MNNSDSDMDTDELLKILQGTENETSNFEEIEINEEDFQVSVKI